MAARLCNTGFQLILISDLEMLAMATKQALTYELCGGIGTNPRPYLQTPLCIPVHITQASKNSAIRGMQLVY